MAKDYVISSESVGPGHPDKMCDVISDSVLDACLKEDPNSRVACETAVKGNWVCLFGEITTLARPDYEQIARDAIRKIGYGHESWSINPDNCRVDIRLSTQSPDIAQGVNTCEKKEQGAGDQGIMWGYATNETKELMPLSAYLAHRLVERLDECRESGYYSYFRPDTKSQVAVRYKNGKIAGLDNVVIALSHSPEITEANMGKLRDDVKTYVIKLVCGDYLTKDTTFFINGTGKFELCGPYADAGLTGRKIIVDTYGGIGRHGGGAFSGKDPSKVDRSAAYMTRYVAKNIVAAGLADKCEVQLSYSIGVAEPVSVLVETFGTGKIPEEKISELVRKHFLLKPAQIIEHLNLLRPIYKKTAAYGHFGRNDPDFTWEKTDKAGALKQDAGL
ncbi:MAG: methionine adenosyltransferase [Nanoarchaeota archaeon]